MKNQPLLVSIIIGIIVIFVIVGASLVVKLSQVSSLFNKEATRTMELSEENESLKDTIASLEKENIDLEEEKISLNELVGSLNEELAHAKIEIEKLMKMKDLLEEKLKEELMKDKQSQVKPNIQPSGE